MLLQNLISGAAALDDGELLGVQGALTEPVMTTVQSLLELALRFGLNLLSCWIIVHFFYYPKSRRKDYAFTFLLFSSAMLLLLYAMGRVDVGVGLTLGLFAIFGVIRYRTETVPIREMTYLFVIIAIAAVNGLTPLFRLEGLGTAEAHYALGWGDPLVAVVANALSIILIWVLESRAKASHNASKLILYDRLDLLAPEKRDELFKDIETRCSVRPTDVEIGNIDLLKDSAYIKVYYITDGDTPSTIGGVTRPKDLKIYIFASALALGLCTLGGSSLSAQEVGFNARASVGADWKIVKGLHLSAEYEIRGKDSFSGVDRHQTTVGLEYKVCPYFKAGFDYIFIGGYNSSKTLKPRHRYSLNLTGTYDAGDWRFSLRERLQFTHKAYSINEFQEVRNPLQLKSRITVKYRGFRHLDPFVYFEMRNIFNAPHFSATYSETTATYSDYQFLGYDDAYVNRLRGALGVDWNITKHHVITLTAMYSYCRDKEIDTNKEGTKLKGYNDKSTKQYATLSLGYQFSF